MSRLIDADALYERLKVDEELARDRVIDTPNSFPNGMLNPAAVRYQAQLTERTRLKEIVYDAPTIEERKWIPCSERLPEEDGEYLVTYERNTGLRLANGKTPSGVDRSYYHHIAKRWTMYGKVIAWMPLPEPY